jgi:carboxypeptidase family protein
MNLKRYRAACWLVILAGSTGCTAARIVGKTTLMDEKSAPLPPSAGITLNFINLSGNIDESITSVVTDAQGKYASPVLPPGKYTVEAMYPGFVIERSSVVLKKHGKKSAPFTLKKIREASGKSVREAQTENIPNPGEVKIKPPE